MKKFVVLTMILLTVGVAYISPGVIPAAVAASDEAPRISLEDAKKAFDDSTAIFVDTRNEQAFKESRIQGAVNIPSAEFEAKYNSLPRDKKIIVYCSWQAEHSSASLVLKLKEKGFEDSFALLGGTKAWKDAGYPMEKD